MKLSKQYFNLLLFLSLFCFNHAFVVAQITPTQEKPVKIEVLSQKDSPVQLTLIGARDNPYFEDTQVIEFAIQNISQKRIIAFSPLLSSASYTSGSVTESRFDFEPGKVIQTGLQVNSNKIKSIEKLTLSIDYVLFSDLTWWGPDSNKNSEMEAGYYDGEKYAIGQIKKLLQNQNKEELFRLLRLAEAGKIENNPPEIDKGKTEKWSRGFLSGYRVALIGLLPFDQKLGKYVAIDDKMSLDDFARRFKAVEYNRSVYLDNPN